MAFIQLVSFGCGVDAITTDELRSILEEAGELYTQLKIDDISNLGAVKIRIRSLMAALDARDAGTRKEANDPMAKLEYDETGRLLFTQEMRKEYTILIPQMLPVHFGFFAKLLERTGYHVAILNNDGRSVVDSGLKYVHNDACYPALLVIGQMIDAIQNGGYDPHKVALLITQTGGGCRASNYIHMLRKALEKAGLDYIPVLSLSFGLEKNPGFHWTVGLIRRLIYGMMYGDLIMNVANQVRPYEVSAGDTTAKVEFWTSELLNRFDRGEGMSRKKMRGIFEEICADFKSIPVTGEEKVRVGVVGEIYIKFSSLGNNQLEQFLLDEGAEPVVPGLTDFLIFKIYNRVSDVRCLAAAGPSRPCANSSWDTWRNASWT